MFSDGRLMDLQTRVEILAANVLLFINELTVLDRIDRLETLLDLLWEARDQSAATSLASLTVMIDPQLFGALWKRRGELVERFGFPNDDALIVAIAVYRLSGRHGQVLGTSKAWAIFRILASPGATRGSLCRIFQVIGSDADSVHHGILLDLLKKDTPTSGDTNSRSE
jgi:hypothetical protein